MEQSCKRHGNELVKKDVKDVFIAMYEKNDYKKS